MVRFQGTVISDGKYRTMDGTAESGLDVEISGSHLGVQVRGYVYKDDLDVFDVYITGSSGKTYLGSAIRDEQGNMFFTRDRLTDGYPT